MSSTEKETPQPGLEWSAEEMRRLGYAVVDAVVERHANLREWAPWAGGDRREMEALFREACPEEPGDADDALRIALEEILPRAGRIDHPRFMAFVGASPAWPAILGDWLASGYNIFQGTWLESAGPSQIELVVLDWFREWLGMPETAGGLFTTGGSAANLTAVVAAREKANGAPNPTAYLSEQSHSSMARALRIAGFPEESVRYVPVREDLKMRVDVLEEMMAADLAAGRTPVLVSANGGATNTGIADPLGEVGKVARRRGAWFHVDAAYGGFACLSPRGASLLEGIADADSVTLDPHKWLFQTYEAGCLLARDPGDLTRAFRILPEYLQDTELGLEHVNFGDRGVQLTRRFRALKVWMTLKVHGRRALAAAVEFSMDVADHAGERIRRSLRLELLSEPSMSIVCFRVCAPEGRTMNDAELDEWNKAIQDTVVEEGVAMISSTRIHGHFSLRFCVISYRTTRDDVDAVLDRIEVLAAEGPA